MTSTGTKTTLLPPTHTTFGPSLTRAPGPGRNSPRDSARLATSGSPWNIIEVHSIRHSRPSPPHARDPQPQTLPVA